MPDDDPVTQYRRVETALRKSEEQLASLLSSMDDAVWSITPDTWEVLYLNPAVERIYARPADDFRKDPKLWEKMLHPEDRERVVSSNRRLALTGSMDNEYRIVRDDGTVRWVRSRGQAIRDAAGTVIRFDGIMADITERREAREALRASERELRRSLEELEEVAAAASHDLREPLRAVTSYSELLVRRLGLRGSGTDEFARFITQGVEQMSEVIDGLLRFVTVSRDRLEPGPCNLNTLFKHTCLQLEANTRSGANISCGSLPTLAVDGRRMAEVFRELLDNALKFRGANPPVVRLDAEVGVREWSFSLRDNGIGIEPRHATRVFELYRRLHSSEQYRGRGVGLAICRKIIERHGGRIWLEPGNPGTVVRFTLPVAQLSGDVHG